MAEVLHVGWPVVIPLVPRLQPGPGLPGLELEQSGQGGLGSQAGRNA